MNSFLPDISVIVCCYNHENWIERCIRSINHQSNIDQKDYEIILINDASEDNTKEIIKNLDIVSNLRVVDNDINSGLPASLNKAIRMARGRYVVRVDSDDYVARNFLFFLKFFLDMNRHYQAVATDYVIVDEFENFCSRENCFEKEIACGVMFRKECLFALGLYDEKFKMREGHDLKKRFLEKFSLARLEFPLYKYRKHGSNRTDNVDELVLYEKML